MSIFGDGLVVSVMRTIGGSARQLSSVISRSAGLSRPRGAWLSANIASTLGAETARRRSSPGQIAEFGMGIVDDVDAVSIAACSARGDLAALRSADSAADLTFVRMPCRSAKESRRAKQPEECLIHDDNSETFSTQCNVR